MQIDHLEAILGDVVINVYEGEYDEENNEYSGPGVARLDNDCVYEGEFKKGLFHGKGKFTWANGMIYEGDFKYNKLTGNGTYTYLDGSVYTGQVLNGLRNGQGKLITSTGQVYDGEWKLGKRHGQGKMIYNEEGNYVYQGDWVENLRHGYGTIKYPSGNHYEGEWANDQKSGYGIMIWRDLDEVYTGNWLQDKPDGYGEHIWGDSSAKTIKKQNCNIYRGNYEVGLRHGFGTFFYMNGSQYTGQWKNDMKDGPGIFIHPDGKIIAGNYSQNRLIESLDKEFQNQRVTEDINPQYHLNIQSIFDFYPNLEYNYLLSFEDRIKNQKKIVADIERILLKYNAYLKTVYRFYNEQNNKQRSREIPFIPNIENIFKENEAAFRGIITDEEKARTVKFFKSTITARNISKRFYCLSLEFMIRFLREISLIGIYYNCYDLVQSFKFMKDDQLTESMRQYAELLRTILADRNKALPSNEGTDNEANSPSEHSQSNNNFEELEQGSQCDSVSSLLAEADLSIGKLLDGYQEVFANDPSYYELVSQPLLEHEFVELFVRVIGERQSRLGEPLNLYQATEKVLAINILPFSSNPDLRKNEFYQQFYESAVQDLLRGRPNKGSDPNLEKLEGIWKSLPKSKVFQRPSVKLIQSGGSTLLQDLLNYLMSLKDTGCISAEVTNESLLRAIFGLSPDVKFDTSCALRKIHFEDFLEYLCRVIFSELWVFQKQHLPSDEEKLNAEDEFGVVPPVDSPSHDEKSQLLYFRLVDWLSTL